MAYGKNGATCWLAGAVRMVGQQGLVSRTSGTGEVRSTSMRADERHQASHRVPRASTSGVFCCICARRGVHRTCCVSRLLLRPWWSAPSQLRRTLLLCPWWSASHQPRLTLPQHQLLITLSPRLSSERTYLHLSVSTSRLRQVCTQYQYQCLEYVCACSYCGRYAPAHVGEYISPAPGVYAAPVPVLEYAYACSGRHSCSCR